MIRTKVVDRHLAGTQLLELIQTIGTKAIASHFGVGVAAVLDWRNAVVPKTKCIDLKLLHEKTFIKPTS